MKHTFETGQTLVSLLVFSVMAIAVASATTVIMINSSQATNIMSLRTKALHAAESGIENALIRLIRNPAYSGETLQVEDASVTITVTGSTVRTVRAEATSGDYTQIVEATLEYVNNRLTVTSWNTVY